MASTPAGVRTRSSLPVSGSAGSARQVRMAQARRWSGWEFIGGSFHAMERIGTGQARRGGGGGGAPPRGGRGGGEVRGGFLRGGGAEGRGRGGGGAGGAPAPAGEIRW